MTKGKQQQHVDIYRKLRLRHRALGEVAEGSIYVPFCGDGDIAAECYGERGADVYGVDIDPKRVEQAQVRLPEARFIAGDCMESLPIEIPAPLAIIDSDAYVYPYGAIRAAWSQVKKAETVLVFGTDGTKQAIARSKRYRTPGGVMRDCQRTTAGRRRQYNNYWRMEVLPELEELFGGSTFTVAKYLRNSMIYWAATVKVGS